MYKLSWNNTKLIKSLGHVWFAHNPYLKTHNSNSYLYFHSNSNNSKICVGSKSKLYLSLFSSNFWQNDGAHPLSLHKTVTCVPACDILSLLLSFYCFALIITKPSKKQILCLCTPQDHFTKPSKRLISLPLPTPLQVSDFFFFSLTHSPKTTYANPLKHTNINP